MAFEDLKNEFPRLEEKVMLKDYTTFRIGGPAKYFLRTSDKKELKKIIERAIKENVNFLVIGGGSNTLFSSKGFDGLVIVYKVENIKERPLIEKIGDDYFKVDATIPLSSLIMEMRSYSGLEWGVGIPGTLGGAINGNVGALGESISDSVESVDVLEIKNGEVIEKTFKKKECCFGYRTSIFKNNQELLIISAKLNLSKGEENEIQERIKSNLDKRKAKQPKGFSAGSVFKNYSGKISDSIVSGYPELKPFNEKEIIPAGLLIALSQLKGKQIGDAKISEEHANFIINLGKATSDDVLSLISLIKKTVKEKFSVNLEEEIKIF
ncbi:MAG: UDP-N-acetylmuramate dehydrogenase [Candidatus Paceibacterota bacterium]